MDNIDYVYIIHGKANGNGDSRKNDRDGNTLTTGRSLRVHSSRRSIPGKILTPTNQIKNYQYVHTYPANYARVHFRVLGVYKGSRVA